MSKAPREAHVATQVGFLASGDEDLPPTGSCSESAAQQRVGSPLHRDQGAWGHQGDGDQQQGVEGLL